MGDATENTLDELYALGVEYYGQDKFNNMFWQEIHDLSSIINGLPVSGTNITTNLIKKFQRVPTQLKLDAFHTAVLSNKSNDEKLMRDFHLYKQLDDFIDLSKPRDYCVIKFHNKDKLYCVKYKKTQTLQIPWLILWMKHFPDTVISFCTDIYNYLRLFGPLCSLINLSNLLNRIETKDINYTLILLSLTVYPNSDVSPISRNGTVETNEVIKRFIYEDCYRKMKKINGMEDPLIHSRSRNILNLPSLQGTNFHTFIGSLKP